MSDAHQPLEKKIAIHNSQITLQAPQTLLSPFCCIGMMITDIVVKKPALEINKDEHYEPVRVEYEGKLNSNEYSFRVISRISCSKFLGWVPFRETRVLGPIRDKIQLEGVIPHSKATSTRIPLYIILYCQTKHVDTIANHFKVHQLYLKQPPFYNPRCHYYNPHPEARQQSLQHQRSFTNTHHHDGQIQQQQQIEMLLNSIAYEEEEEEREENLIVQDGLTIELMKHQLKGVHWMIDREHNKSSQGGILADMGLGKTIQMIALMTTTATTATATTATTTTTLIVTPLALIHQWINEIQQKSPTLNVLRYHGPNRTNDSNVFKNYDVVVTTYQLILSDKETLFNFEWYRIVLDEAHYIKNHQTKISIRCCELQAKKRWCLTGTPIQNNINELYSFFRFLKIEPWSNYKAFRKMIYQNSNSNEKMILEKIRSILMAIMLRRTKKEDNTIVYSIKYRQDILLEFNEDYERSLYNMLLNRTRVLVFEYNENRYINMLCLLLRLRQACNHPQLVFNSITQDKDALDIINHQHSTTTTVINNNADGCCKLCGNKEDLPFCKECKTILSSLKSSSSDNNSRSSTKMKKLLEILQETRVQNPKEKTIIFSQFTSMLDLMEDSLRENGFQYSRYDGSMSTILREKNLIEFKHNPECTIMLISLKCGSLGLNLTEANRVILMDIWWNPAIEEQAIDRVYRIGQRLPVYVTRLLIDNSIELKMLALQEKKAQLMKSALGENSFSSIQQKLTTKELRTLFDL
ncbi:SNF2 family N-terminal domain-containing protein [Cokeromyces recurvatus]|uniref:SNF2 family N-terminal domain-containing protein n=1 Tax=Cokeromyces recurvatus TaxID=90255 RepID=UPI00222067F7|nr:SNF2 family N-terminal domain-containing protein [Cokeromyces recurvatus]KAI7898532.1 SNF2 family N-terminal domain-containing protein [Cokeromyces recurvatus]